MSKLFIVATPIGNLGDISLRALDTLKDVDYIACEDSRVTRKLLNHFNITNKKLLVHHNFNERNSAQGIIKLLAQGFKVALVSDAGMPTIADPGYNLINHAISQQIPLQVIPGPSAVIVANVLANFGNEFTFIGFLKDKSGQRINQLKALHPGVHVAFVSPYKLIKSLDDLQTVYGSNIEVFLGKELTKMYEHQYRGMIKDIINEFKTKQIKGEYTIVFKVK